MARHRWTGQVKRCPIGSGCPPIKTIRDGLSDFALINCTVHGDILIIAPEFIPFVEQISKDTALFYCHECGETEAWGNVPEKYRATTPCKCQRNNAR